MMDNCKYTCVQTHRIYNTEDKSECKQWTLGDNEVLK